MSKLVVDVSCLNCNNNDFRIIDKKVYLNYENELKPIETISNFVFECTVCGTTHEVNLSTEIKNVKNKLTL